MHSLWPNKGENLCVEGTTETYEGTKPRFWPEAMRSQSWPKPTRSSQAAPAAAAPAQRPRLMPMSSLVSSVPSVHAGGVGGLPCNQMCASALVHASACRCHARACFVMTLYQTSAMPGALYASGKLVVKHRKSWSKRAAWLTTVHISMQYIIRTQGSLQSRPEHKRSERRLLGRAHRRLYATLPHANAAAAALQRCARRCACVAPCT